MVLFLLQLFYHCYHGRLFWILFMIHSMVTSQRILKNFDNSSTKTKKVQLNYARISFILNISHPHINLAKYMKPGRPSSIYGLVMYNTHTSNWILDTQNLPAVFYFKLWRKIIKNAEVFLFSQTIRISVGSSHFFRGPCKPILEFKSLKGVAIHNLSYAWNLFRQQEKRIQTKKKTRFEN